MKVRHVLTTTVASLISGLANFLITVLVAHLVSTTETGHFSQFIVLFNIFYTVTNFGLAQSATYAIAAGRRRASGVMQFQVRYLAILFGFVALLVTFSTWNSAAQPLAALQIPVNIFVAAVAGGACFVALNLQQGILYGALKFDTVNLLNVARTILPVPLIAVAAMWLRSAFTFSILYVGATLIALILAAIVCRAVIKSGDSRVSGHESFTNSDMFRYGGFVYGANLLHYLSMRGLVFFIGLYGTIPEVGFFSIALLLLEGILLVPNAIGQVIFPSSSQLDLAGKKVQMTIKFNVIFGLATVLIFLLAAKPTIDLVLGAQYENVYVALLWMIPAFPLLAVPKVLSQVLSGRGAPHIPFIAAIVSFCAFLVIGALVLRTNPLIGAAMAIDVIALVTFLITAVGYSKTYGIDLFDILVPTPRDLTEIMDAGRRMLRKRS